MTQVVNILFIVVRVEAVGAEVFAAVQLLFRVEQQRASHDVSWGDVGRESATIEVIII